MEVIRGVLTVKGKQNIYVGGNNTLDRKVFLWEGVEGGITPPLPFITGLQGTLRRRRTILTERILTTNMTPLMTHAISPLFYITYSVNSEASIEPWFIRVPDHPTSSLDLSPHEY